MKAVVIRRKKITVEEIPPPAPAEGEALIRVLKAGICRTDLELLEGYMGFQGVPGHEFVGRVEEAVDGRWVGARVVGEINIPCRRCPVCRAGRPKHCPSRKVLGISGKQGIFAEYAALPLENLHLVPPELSDTEAVFVEPLAAALDVLDKVEVDAEEDVLVLGDGKLGLLVAQALAAQGSRVTCRGRHARKLSLLEEQGVRTTLEKAPRRAFDLVVEATGTPSGIEDALQSVRAGGKVAVKSTFHGKAEIDLSSLVVDEIRLIGSRCGPFPRALSMLKDRSVRVGKMVDGEYSLAEARKAFEHAARPGCMKILFSMEEIGVY